MGIAYNPKIITNGLLLYLDAANLKCYPGSGSTVVDLQKNFTGTVDSGVTVSNSFDFDGTANKKITGTFSSSQFINTNYTWSAWVKGQSTGSANMPHIGFGSGGWPRLGFRDGNGWFFSAYNANGVDKIDIGIGSRNTTSWINLCAVGDYTNSLIKTYRNTVYQNGGTYVNTTGNGSIFGIGQGGGTFSGWNEGFLGSISCISIYNRVLSEEEIKQNFNAFRGRHGL